MTTVERGRGAADRTRRPTASRAGTGADMVAFAPVWLLVALLYHPFIADLTDKASVAAALTPDPVRWGFSHLAVGVGSALLVLAFIVLRRYLRDAGEHRWSRWGLPFIVVGSTLFAFLPAMEIAMLGVLAAGADVRAVLVAMDPWFVPILLAGSITFALGILGFAVGIVRSGVLGRSLAWGVAAMLVLSAAGRFVPSTTVLLLGAVASIAALWPLAYRMHKRPQPARTAES
ncbi:MAG: hypothetical protein GEV09_10150 [Pseudonocardiaceae bacterium]|nr:hypothetical protein [Pseudonocardiaceae bacterium]